MPWVVVTIPDELEKNGQPQNEKMKFESSKHETKLSMKLTAQVQARILSKTHRVYVRGANRPLLNPRSHCRGWTNRTDTDLAGCLNRK